MLLSAASYYLCDLPGSAAVLIRSLGGVPDVNAHGIEAILTWLLKGDFREGLNVAGTEYAALVSGIAQGLAEFSAHGIGRDAILEQADALRHESYANGSPRDLLFADVSCALVRKRLENSTWMSLPEYSGLPIETWRETLQRPSFVRELWPAQHLLGSHGVFRGASATVQMPTSAGKTKATELIIRSAFLSGRTSLAVIVAPFRSLCHEIRNSFLAAFQGEAVKVDELTDVFQNDFDINAFLITHHPQPWSRSQVLVKSAIQVRHACSLRASATRASDWRGTAGEVILPQESQHTDFKQLFDVRNWLRMVRNQERLC